MGEGVVMKRLLSLLVLACVLGVQASGSVQAGGAPALVAENSDPPIGG